MSMTESEAIRRLKDHFRVHDDGRPTPYLDEAVSMAISTLEKVQKIKELGDCYIIPKNSTWEVNGIDIHKALEEIQQYRAIGTVEEVKTLHNDYWKLNEICKEYSAIGTVSDFRELKEKATAKPIKGKRFKEAICPCCLTELYETYWAFGGVHYCVNCGTAVDWSEGKE